MKVHFRNHTGSRPPTSETALKHPPKKWQRKSRPCRTRSRNSPKRWPTKKTHQTAVVGAAVAAVVAAVAADYVKVDKDELRSIQKATKHGLLLFLARFPSSRQEPHKRQLPKETAKPRRHVNVEQQERWQHVLATTHLRQHWATEPRNLHRQVSTNKLTGTRAG